MPERSAVDTEATRRRYIDVDSVTATVAEKDTDIHFARNLATMQYIRHFGVEDERGMKTIDFGQAYGAMYRGTPQYPSVEFIGNMSFKYNGTPRIRRVSAMRLTSGIRDEHPIEATKHFSIPGIEQVNPATLCEIGRLAFIPMEELRVEDKEERKKIRAGLLKQKTRAAADAAKEMGHTTMYAVMPSGILEFFAIEGITPTRVEGAEMKDNEEITQLKRDFPGYWVDQDPAVYVWDVEELIEACEKPKEHVLVTNP